MFITGNPIGFNMSRFRRPASKFCPAFSFWLNLSLSARSVLMIYGVKPANIFICQRRYRFYEFYDIKNKADATLAALQLRATKSILKNGTSCATNVENINTLVENEGVSGPVGNQVFKNYKKAEWYQKLAQRCCCSDEGNCPIIGPLIYPQSIAFYQF